MAEKCFIMVDGIDGSGKSSIVKHWKEYLTGEGNGIFDLKDYWLEQKKYPESSELKSYDFIFTSEPSYVGIGKVLREELMRSGTNYPDRAIAEAFSLDRLVLYEKIILPSLKDGKCIIQDRGVSTSLCYQSLSGRLSVKELSQLVGNAKALKNAPNHLVIMKVDPGRALGRLDRRTEKKDNVIFEQLDFQTKAAELFYSNEFGRMFEAHGTEVHYLPADAELDIIKAESIKLLNTILLK